MNTSDTHGSSAAQPAPKIDFSDLLGVNQAFLPEADPARQAELIDAICNKIGNECCC